MVRPVPARGGAFRLALLLAAAAPGAAHAQVLFSDDFTNATTSGANYNIFQTMTATSNGSPTSDATFAYDYSALGIPVAPHSTDGQTLGLRLRVDNLANSASGYTVGAITVATKNLDLTSTNATAYTVQADVWGNFIGSGTSVAVSGSNGTTAAAMGLGTAGTGLQSITNNDGILAYALHDGAAGATNNTQSGAYRMYNKTTTYTDNSYYAATTDGTFGPRDSRNSFYTRLFPSQAPPAKQSDTSQPTGSATQGGMTTAGNIGFAWHTFTLTQTGVSVVWAIDGTTIATVQNSSIVGNLGGTQVSLNAIDTGTGGSSVVLNQLYNADIWDNLTVTQIAPVPEPAGMTLVGFAGVAAWARYRRRRVQPPTGAAA